MHIRPRGTRAQCGTDQGIDTPSRSHAPCARTPTCTGGSTPCSAVPSAGRGLVRGHLSHTVYLRTCRPAHNSLPQQTPSRSHTPDADVVRAAARQSDAPAVGATQATQAAGSGVDRGPIATNSGDVRFWLRKRRYLMADSHQDTLEEAIRLLRVALKACIDNRQTVGAAIGSPALWAILLAQQAHANVHGWLMDEAGACTWPLSA